MFYIVPDLKLFKYPSAVWVLRQSAHSNRTAPKLLNTCRVSVGLVAVAVARFVLFLDCLSAFCSDCCLLTFISYIWVTCRHPYLAIVCWISLFVFDTDCRFFSSLNHTCRISTHRRCHVWLSLISGTVPNCSTLSRPTSFYGKLSPTRPEELAIPFQGNSLFNVIGQKRNYHYLAAN